MLDFNEEKCNVMHSGDKTLNYAYTMGQTTLATSKKEKDLGELITPNLKPSKQVARAVAVANSMLGRTRTISCQAQDEHILVPSMI